MARPIKEGLDYYPQDTDVHEDKKIRKLLTECKSAGYLIYDYIKTLCYKEHGYWVAVQDDFTFDISDSLKAADITEEMVINTMSCCFRVRLFDHNIYLKYSILTSAGIQRRFLRAKRNGIISEKIKVITPETIVNADETLIKPSRSTQSKVKERKVKERKGKETGIPPHFLLPIQGNAPTLTQVQEFFLSQGADMGSAERFFNKFEGLGWKQGITPITNWRAFANNWISDPFNVQQAIKQAETTKGTGRTVIMEHNGGEVPWTEARYNEYKSNPNASGYTFLRYEL